jgi:hypothetical protein
VARALPHHWGVLEHAKTEGKELREAIKVQCQIERQGRATSCLLAGIFDEQWLGWTLGKGSMVCGRALVVECLVRGNEEGATLVVTHTHDAWWIAAKATQ